ncbi:MAG: Helix-turn-helix domain [Mucilaginibacter sp.]|nr:Helix-turn-helix domain [Mucilaginibacter sp.]
MDLSLKDLTKFAQTNVKELRRMSGMTQQEFANTLDVKRSLLGAIEEGRSLSIMTMYKISVMYEISVDDLITKLI